MSENLAPEFASKHARQPYFTFGAHSSRSGLTECCPSCAVIDMSVPRQEGHRHQLEPQLDSDHGGTVTCSRAAAPKLQLDYDKVLR
jgi:hypothetical protein